MAFSYCQERCAWRKLYVFVPAILSSTLPLTDGGRGESYHAFYVGSLYFIYGYKLKLMLGAEYATLDGGGDGGDYDGWTVLTGVRVSF